MSGRRAAGWAVLSLIPATFVALAAIAGQLPELAAGVGIAVFVCGAAFAGVHLLTGDKEQS